VTPFTPSLHCFTCLEYVIEPVYPEGQSPDCVSVVASPQLVILPGTV